MMSRRSSMLAAACGVIGSLIVVTPTRAALSTWSLRGQVQLQTYSDAVSNYNVVADVSTTNTSILNGLTVAGNGASTTGSTLVYTLTGAQYAALNPGTANTNTDRGLRLIGIDDGVLAQAYDNVNHRIQTNATTEFNFNGAGTVNLFNVESGYGLLDASDNLLQLVSSSGETGTYTAGDSTSTAQYVDNFGGPDANFGTHIVGSFVIGFEWTGYAATDVLQISLPNVTVQQTPEPATAALLAPFVMLLKRRRRTGA